jgi:3-oxoacyl-(acyl-carrier-protein) synthase III
LAEEGVAMKKAHIVHVTHFMPERVVDNKLLYEKNFKESEYNQDADLENNVFFKGVRERRFASPDYLSEEMGEIVLTKLLKEAGYDASDLDLIICSCIFSDTYWPGISTAIQNRVGAHNASAINIDTSCASFITGLNIARGFIDAGIYKTIAVLTVTNFVSRLPEFQKSFRSYVLGDGAAAALVVAKEKSNILGCFEKSFGENYGLMRFEPDFVEGRFLNFWERGCGPITVNFTGEKIDKIRENAMKIVPFAINQCLKQAGLTIDEVDLVITHQPNQFFIDEWRKRLAVKPNQVFDTLEYYGNLFQGSVAVTLAAAIEKKIVKPGDIIVIGTFSNGGDFASSIALQWA